MNTAFHCHFPYQSWEDYALGLLSRQQAESLEEHLLVCSACQDLLEEADAYLAVARAALKVVANANSKKRRRTSKKAMGAAANLR